MNLQDQSAPTQRVFCNARKSNIIVSQPVVSTKVFSDSFVFSPANFCFLLGFNLNITPLIKTYFFLFIYCIY